MLKFKNKIEMNFLKMIDVSLNLWFIETQKR